jgi:hypothetical protein
MSEWVEVDGVKLLLYRLVKETSLESSNLLREFPNLGGSWDSLLGEKVGSYLRKTLPSVLGECSLYYVEVELGNGDILLGYTYSTERLRCLPVSTQPDAVLSVEILSRPQMGSVEELDVVQRGILTSRKVLLGGDLYTICLVGKVEEDAVAVGFELASGGLKVFLADELESTALAKVPRGQTRRTRKKKRRSRRTSKK